MRHHQVSIPLLLFSLRIYSDFFVFFWKWKQKKMRTLAAVSAMSSILNQIILPEFRSHVDYYTKLSILASNVVFL